MLLDAATGNELGLSDSGLGLTEGVAVIAATPERALELARTDERLLNWLACYLDRLRFVSSKPFAN